MSIAAANVDLQGKKIMLRDLLIEKSGLYCADRLIIYDEDELVACVAAFGDDKHNLHWINSLEELRYIYERDYRNSETKTILLIPSKNIQVPFDIMRRFMISRLGFDSVFPEFDAATLRAARNIDFDYLSIAVKNLNGRRLTAKQTKDFYKFDMFNQEIVNEYTTAVEQILMLCVASCDVYRDWMPVINLLSKLMLLRDKGFSVEDFQNIYDTVDTAFRSWMAQNYAMLATSADVNQPVMLHHIPDFVRRISKKPAVIVVDGMSFVDWQLIQEHFTDETWKLTTTAVFSFLPSVTSIARQSLFSGAIPAQNEKPFSLADEEKQWRSYWLEHGLRDVEVFFGKTETPDIPYQTKAACIIVNYIDDLMHRQLQGTYGMSVDIAAWLKNGSLRRLIDNLLKMGFDVFVTADHGHSEAIGKGRFSKPGLLTEDASRRAVIYKDFAGVEEISKFNVTEYAGTYIPKNYRYFLFANNECIGDYGNKYITHGGDSIEELLVPFVRIGEA